MNARYLDLATRVAALSAFLQTEQEVEKSPTLKSKLVGEELRRHLLLNTQSITQHLRKQYDEARPKGKKKLLKKWNKFYEEYKNRWPKSLDLIKAGPEKSAS